ncbi:MAG: hypothetical protein ACYDG2_15060, partial [Ruminiclostridium sp.]
IYELVDLLNEGKGYDLYRLLLIEASAYGCNMSVPYGAWMGNIVKDAFWPPRDVTAGVQDFLVNNERLYSKHSGANVLVLYSFPSNYWTEAITGYSNSVLDGEEEGTLSYSVIDPDDPNGVRMPFWEVTRELSKKQISYDVKFMADGDLREDCFSIKDIESYDLIILPECNTLTENQAKVIEEYAKLGNKVLIFGDAAQNLSGWQDKLVNLESAEYCINDSYKPTALKEFGIAFESLYKNIWQVTLDNTSLGIQTHTIENGMAIHLVNYNYSTQEDAVELVKELNIKINCKCNDFGGLKIHTLRGESLRHESCIAGDIINIEIYDVPIYTVVELIKE